MVLARYQNTILGSDGLPVAGAAVLVVSETTGALAQLYSDRAGTVTQNNPITADDDGFVGFYVSGDAYKIIATKDDQAREHRYVPIGTAAEDDKNLITVTEATLADASNVIFSGTNFYKEVQIEIERLTPVTDGEDLFCYVSEDGGSNYLGGTLNNYTLDKSTGSTQTRTGANATTGMMLADNLGNAPGEFYKSTIILKGHLDTSIYKTVESKGTQLDADGALRVSNMNGIVTTGGAITNLALQMSSGNLNCKVTFKGVPL